MKDLIPRAIYKSPLTGEDINKKQVCDKVLTRVILKFCTNQLYSSPSILVNGSEKANIPSLKKSVLCLIETTEKFRILTFSLRHEQFID